MSSNCIWDKKSVQDGILEDEYLDVPTGLRHCRECGKPRQKQFVFNGRVWTPDIPCLCQEKVRQQAEAAVKQRDQMADISRMRISGLQDKNLLQSTFAKDLGFNASAMRKAKQYVEHWEEMKRNNAGMMLLGDTGTGKTFMAGCIANRFISRGYSVVYQSAYKLFQFMEDYKFNRVERNAESGLFERIYNADLLIIDDLGTEFSTAYTCSVLFDILNTRLLNKKSTVISSNLNLDNLIKKYTDRVSSRIIGYFEMMRFTGDDIRIAKKQNRR